MFKKVNDLLNKNVKVLPLHSSARELSEDFAGYFQNKVTSIHEAFADSSDTSFEQSSAKSCSLSDFDCLNENDVRAAIVKAPAKSCALDPVPTWFLKQNIDTFVPIVTHIINKSLSTGTFPESLKQSVITPLIKKPSLDPNNIKNYRPVSNLPFLSKLIEKQACKVTNDYLEKNHLGEEFQSAYKRAHSTETALIKVKDDIMMSLSQRKGVCLVLLDLSSAFDTISHDIFLDRLKYDLGIDGMVHDWYKSYLSGRTSKVCINDHSSKPRHMKFGLPQGSVVGPLGFTLYILPIGNIIKSYNLHYHVYADDIQLYATFDPNDVSSLAHTLNNLSCCIDSLKCWMRQNMLKLNDDKTEFFVALPAHLKCNMPPISLRIGDKSIGPSEIVRNLGVVFDSTMCMSNQVKSLCSSLRYQLRLISRIRRFLDYNTCHHVIRALVLSKLDYGNGLLLGINTSDMNRLQRIQNWAAKMICQVLKRDHATPCLRKLHWLPVDYRIKFKILLTVFKCINDMCPNYLSTSITPYRPSRSGLRSATDTTLLTVHNTIKMLQSAERRTFHYSAPRMWNDLPKNIRQSPSIPSFKRALKTHLYKSLL